MKAKGKSIVDDDEDSSPGRIGESSEAFRKSLWWTCSLPAMHSQPLRPLCEYAMTCGLMDCEGRYCSFILVMNSTTFRFRHEWEVNASLAFITGSLMAERFVVEGEDNNK